MYVAIIILLVILIVIVLVAIDTITKNQGFILTEMERMKKELTKTIKDE